VLANATRNDADSASSASSAVEKLIDALIESEMNTVWKALRKYSMLDDDYNMPEVIVLEGIQRYNEEFEHKVKNEVKEKLKDLTVKEAIDKAQEETQNAYKAAAKKQFAYILDDVLD
jgi:ribosomal protein S20